jgi:hypothetical protein
VALSSRVHAVLRANQCSGLQPIHENAACHGRGDNATMVDQIVWSSTPDQCSDAGASETTRWRQEGQTIQPIGSTGESVEFPERGIYVMETP